MSHRWKTVGKGKKGKKGRSIDSGSINNEQGQHHLANSHQNKTRPPYQQKSQQDQSYAKPKSKPSAFKPNHLSKDDLVQLAGKGCNEIVQNLLNQIKLFQNTLETPNFCAKEMSLVLRILIKVSKGLSFEGEVKANTIMILSEIFSTRCPTFQSQLKVYVVQMVMRHTFNESELALICDFFLELLKVIPGSCWTILPLDELTETISMLSAKKLLKNCSCIESMHKSILQIRDSMKEQQMVTTINKLKSGYSKLKIWDNSEYRTLSILPQWPEVSDPRPPWKLRPNIVDGEYEDWEHYYDVQFRLLREDFIAPLRKGIKDYRDGKVGREVSNLRIYNGVVILSPIFTKAGLCHKIQFNTDRFQRTNWEHSKRLIFGSLLCLSSDSFQYNSLFATVSNRDSDQLKHGYVEVQFQEEAKVIMHQKLKTQFVMVESIAFYEASCHILKSLQQAEDATMPFTKYIIKNSGDSVGLPNYLEVCSEGATYDISFIIKKEVLKSPKLATAYSHVDITNSLAWPPLEDTVLDESQLKALKMALTQEVAVIQGPPGTGKTYIGLKIVQALLKNSNFWSSHKDGHAHNNNVSGGPILVMCFTNHALDQFLEGIMDLTGKNDVRLIRIGSRSKNEKIQEYSLYKAMQNRRLIPYEAHLNFMEYANKAEEIGGVCKDDLARYSDPVHEFFGFSEIKQVISEHHNKSLRDGADSPEEKDLALEIWLGLYDKKEYTTFDPIEFINDELEVVESDDSDLESDDDFDSDDEYETASSNFNESDEESIAKEESEEVTAVVVGDAEHEQEARLIEGMEDMYKGIKLQNALVPKPKKPKRTHNLRRTVKVEKCQDYSTFLQSKTKDLSSTQFTEYEAENLEDLNRLGLDQRWELYKYWHSKYRDRLLEKLEEKCMKYNEACDEANAAKHNKERYALETAHIIGMTTTGAAKYQHVLHMVKPKIVIVEEAAEVLESHIVSALNAGTQHLILIGDHKQLRPKPNEYDLAKKYKLDISLFERLVINNFPRVTLENQHRMRPQIAELVHPHIYDTLYNHDSVCHYPEVKGVCRNLFFINHDHSEQPSSDLSHANEYEAKYLLALCKYLLQQGYLATQITIIVTYTGQLLLLKNATKSKYEFRGVRICTVDNFQGEENDIILLSLVRSNQEGKIGFLSEDNRVCVSLSRAKHGFYCIGNFTMLRRKSNTWQEIMSDMESKGNYGNGLEIHCTNHPNNKSIILSHDDFARITPKGGCNLDCGKRLKCGHTCPQKCHMVDPDHKTVICLKPCSRLCTMGHQCTKLCYEVCKCTQIVEKEFPGCGHKINISCFEDIKRLHCQLKVPKIIPRCGHEKLVPCHVNPRSFQCFEDVEQTIPKCGHKQFMKCSQNPMYVKCTTQVSKVLSCSHSQEMICSSNPAMATCDSQCSNNCPRNLHQCPMKCHYRMYKSCPPCTVYIEETLKCGHKQEIQCHENADLVRCDHQCDKVCDYGHPCQQKCYQKCLPCRVSREITPPCSHSITVCCFESKTYVCTKLVDKQLDCGHTKPLSCSIDPKSVKCNFLVSMTLLKCRHTLEVQCSLTADVSQIKCRELVEKRLHCGRHFKEVLCSQDIDTIKCFEKVPVTLKCKHTRILKCHIDPDTVKCDEMVDKILTCGHKKRVHCYVNPSPDDCVELCYKTLPCGHENKVKCNESPDKAECKKTCDKVLDCEHKCQLKCGTKCSCHRIVNIDLPCGHSVNVPCQRSKDISKIKCTYSCKNVLSCGHPCRKMCYDKCTEKCQEWVTDTCSQGHSRTVPCYKVSSLGSCSKKCEKKLECGHSCKELCSKPCTTKCRQAVIKKYSCGHSHKIPCSSPPEAFPCDLDCKHPLSCGHLCDGKCSDCSTTRIHKPCSSSSGLKHFCGEKTRLPCLGLKSRHTKSITGKYLGQVIRCKHVSVSWKCFNKLPQCFQPCEWSCAPECPHPKKCSRVCSELCDRAPCNERCPKLLHCKRHRCKGLCGEPCIKICPECDPDQFSDRLQNSPAFSDKEIYVQLPCDHIFTVADMDAHVHPKADQEVSPLQCPACFTPLSRSYRYGNAMKKSLQDVEEVKRVIDSRRQNKDLLVMYSDTGKKLRNPQVKAICSQHLYQTFFTAMKKICETKLTSEEEFFLYILVKIVNLLSKPNISAVALDIIETLGLWIHKHLGSPKLSFQVSYDILSEYFRLILEDMLADHPRSTIVNKHFDRLRRDPFFRISSKEFEQYSQKIDEHNGKSILHEVNLFLPMVKNGIWRKCVKGHFYCIPTTRPDLQYLKVQCFECNAGLYSTSIVVEVPNDAQSVSQRHVNIAGEREKAIMEEQQRRKQRPKGLSRIEPDFPRKSKNKRSRRGKKRK